MTIEVTDARTNVSVATTLRDHYPVGAFIYLRSVGNRAVVIGHTETEVIVLIGDEKRSIVPDDDFIVLARSAEDYAQRVANEARRLTREHGYTMSITDAALEHLLTQEDQTPDVLCVVVHTVGHYLVQGRVPGTDDVSAEQVTELLRHDYYARHGEFGQDRFRQLNQATRRGELVRSVPMMSVTIEVVDHFPEPDTASHP